MEKAETESNGKANGGNVPALVNGKDRALRQILDGDGTLPTAESVGDITTDAAGATAQALNERHLYTVDERKAIAVKVTTKAMQKAVEQRLIKAGVLDAPVQATAKSKK